MMPIVFSKLDPGMGLCTRTHGVYLPWLMSRDTCMQSSEPFLSSSELEEVALVENWYFLFAVMGTLQLSRYLSNRNGFDQRGAHFTHTHTHMIFQLLILRGRKRRILPDDTVEAADLLVGAEVVPCQVLHAGCSTVSDLQRGRRVFQTHRWTLPRGWKGRGKLIQTHFNRTFYFT